MKIRRFNENMDDPYNEEVDDDFDPNIFFELNRHELRGHDPMNFLRSLKLSKEQYKKLSRLIEDYGYERWDEGNSRGYDQGYDVGYDISRDRE